ncbi:MAG TPA: segregation/condensation protein A [Pirellulales bacterium]|jgi:segregation and condensation protein A|nr:segregation/condensation protein A [Pirellulales bacterium]
MAFRVDLDIFRGPLDLLLYLVRKHEVDVVDIPIAAVAEQFLEYLSVLEQLDVNAVGDFLEMASTLVEIKSRQVLPRAEEEEEGVLEDPRQELVQRLLEYKKFKDAASILDERSREWQERFPRLANDLPARQRNLADEPIHELELWDLVSAFGRVMRDTQTAPASNIVYDDTPIHVHMSRIHERLQSTERVAFSQLFQGGMHKSSLIGMFLAILELVRHHGVRAEQDDPSGEIWILPGEQTPETIDTSAVDNYEGGTRNSAGGTEQAEDGPAEESSS